MIRSTLVALAAAAITVSAFAVSPADARTKKEGHYVIHDQSSLDGRVTGRARTCGFATFQYDNRGVPMGPYCH
jgi:hypothetical protein